MSSHLNCSLTGRRMPIAAIALGVLLFAANARAQQPPPLPPQTCGEGVFTVNSPVLAGPPMVLGPSRTLTLPKGCSMYLLIVSDHGRNNQMNELTFYPLAKWVAENGGYVHWAWWNDLLREYMGGTFSSHANPGPPTFSYPGLVERGWHRDGAPPVMDFLADLFGFDPLDQPEVNGVASPTTNSQFVLDAREFLEETRNQNQEALIFAVGHGFGAGSLIQVFEGLSPTVEIDLVGLIDPVGSEETPGVLRSNLNTYRGSQWRAKRKFLGYRQADCIRNTTFPFLCTNHASGFLKFDYRCLEFGRPADTASGWLAEPPLLPSRAPLQCKGPEVHQGTLYRIFSSPSNIRQVVQRFQPESRVPIHPGQSPSPLLTCRNPNNADPILQAIVAQADGHEGALPLPEVLQGLRNATLDCNPDDGHDELIGDRGISEFVDLDALATDCEFDFAVLGFQLPWWSAIATNVCDAVEGFLVKTLLEHVMRPGNTTGPVHHQTGRVAYGSMVTGQTKFGLTDVQEYLASIGRPTPTEAWPACATCGLGPAGYNGMNVHNFLPPDMANSSNAESRRLALISMAAPGPWAFQPLLPELCLVCDELIGIASNMLDENTPDDTASPTTTPESSPEPNDQGWTAGDLVITLSATDNPGGSGVREIVVSKSGAESGSTTHTGAAVETTITTEGITTVTFAARDREDNEESPPQTLVVKIDKTAPTIEFVAAPPRNALGWNNTDVTVSYTASDALSGLAHLSPAAPIVVTTEAKELEIPGYAIDLAGNEAGAGPTLFIDKTPPEIVPVPDIAPNGHGWNNTDVRVSFEASDALSGIASSSPERVVSNEGAGQQIPGTATDRADNTTTTSVSLSIDKTAPVIALSSRTPANAAGWNNTDVTLTWNCTDALSGPVVNQVVQALNAEGAAQNATGNCADRAGHTAGDTQSGINIDKTSPTSQITTPADGAAYLLNANVNAAYGCADALSGVSACVGAVASGAAFDTATVGDKTFTVSAADAAGNHSAVSHSYTVQYAFSGFSNPIAAPPAVNTANAGRTVPVKYSLRDVNGAVISDLTTFVSLVSAPVACDSNVPTAEAEETDGAGSTTIHFESGQFIYNWKTQSAWAGTCRVLQLTLNDGTRHMVAFQFK